MASSNVRTRFRPRQWLNAWLADGNTAFATMPRQAIMLSFDGDRVDDLLTTLRAENGNRRLYRTLVNDGLVREFA